HGNVRGERRGRHAGQEEFGAEARSLKGAGAIVRKGRVLGSMHAVKMAMWLEYTERCAEWLGRFYEGRSSPPSPT
ncbi:MAG: hypothetical protein DRI48_10155, partial [Chloroflexi bacterium]